MSVGRFPPFSAVLLMLGFLALILLPITDHFFHVAPQIELRENRDTEEFPEWSWAAAKLDVFPAEFEKAFNDHFGFRNLLVQLRSRFLYHSMGISPSPLVAAGKEGWLYYAPSLDEYRGVEELSEEVIQRRLGDWLAKEKYFAERGIRYLIVVVPNKEDVYPEYLPDNVRQIRENRFIDQLNSRIPSGSPLQILDLTTVLRESKAIGPLYLRTDTHWTRLGSFVAASEIVRQLNRWFPALQPQAPPRNELMVESVLSDDLRIMMALPKAKLDKDVTGFPPPAFSSVPADPVYEKYEWNRNFDPLAFDSPGKEHRVVLIGDSFSTDMRLSLFLPNYFRSVATFFQPKPAQEWFQRLVPEIIEREKPDIVIEQIVDRNLNLVPDTFVSSPSPTDFTQSDIGKIEAQGFHRRDDKLMVRGAGAGLAGPADGFSYLHVPARGNVEIVVRIASLTGGDENALAGLMIRENLTDSSKQAFFGISSSFGLNFIYRTQTSTPSVAIKTPQPKEHNWLRLVKQGDSISAYVSVNRHNWEKIGACQLSLPDSFFAGLAVCSGNASNSATAAFGNALLMTAGLDATDNMVLWLKANEGLHLDDNDNVNTWRDQSGQGHDATQQALSAQPRVMNFALNGWPTIYFGGKTEHFLLPPGFSKFSGADIFVVAKPEGKFGENILLDLAGADGISDRVKVNVGGAAPKLAFSVSKGLSPSVVEGDKAIIRHQFQLLEMSQDGQNTGEILNGGIPEAKGVLNNISNGTRPRNSLGSSSDAGDFFHGEVAEVVIYNRKLTADERQGVREEWH